MSARRGSSPTVGLESWNALTYVTPLKPIHKLNPAVSDLHPVVGGGRDALVKPERGVPARSVSESLPDSLQLCEARSGQVHLPGRPTNQEGP